MAAHALLSASGSKRWMSCTPSALLELDFPESSSDFAKEGTLAHELGELRLALHLEHINKTEFNKRLRQIKKNEFYNPEMEDYVGAYVDTVVERINEARATTKDAAVLIEQRLDFSAYVPEGFGTGDVLIVSDGCMEVIDLKYGKGVPVSAENNSQMRLYGLGAYEGYSFMYDIEKVRMTIVQPRLDSISTEELELTELLSWGEQEVKPKADLAIKGEGEFVSGDHCRFCRAKAVCKARADANLELAKYDFAPPPVLTHEDIAQILHRADELQKWAKDVQEYALEQATNHGARFDGFKLVEGRSVRKYMDEAKVVETLLGEGFEEDKLYKKTVLGITDMEKTIGKKKFGELLGELIIKPQGKPALVPESDKRPEINSIAAAMEDFK